jgi:hypothetical protein
MISFQLGIICTVEVWIWNLLVIFVKLNEKLFCMCYGLVLQHQMFGGFVEGKFRSAPIYETLFWRCWSICLNFLLLRRLKTMRKLLEEFGLGETTLFMEGFFTSE